MIEFMVTGRSQRMGFLPYYLSFRRYGTPPALHIPTLRLKLLTSCEKTTGESTNIVSDVVGRTPQKNHQLNLMIFMRITRDIYPCCRIGLTSRHVQIDHL